MGEQFPLRAQSSLSEYQREQLVECFEQGVGYGTAAKALGVAKVFAPLILRPVCDLFGVEKPAVLMANLRTPHRSSVEVGDISTTHRLSERLDELFISRLPSTAAHGGAERFHIHVNLQTYVRILRRHTNRVFDFSQSST